MEICLGTVQLGLEYGIGDVRQPSLEESLEILKIAYENGITVYDTAQAYGNAEEILGEFISRNKLKNKIKVITKLKPNIFDSIGDKSIEKIIIENLNESLKKLNLEKVDGYLLHTPKYIFRDDIIDALVNIKKSGLVENIGVSIYEVEEAMQALELDVIDYIQVPYNIFDRRLEEVNFFEKAKIRNKKIFSRSVFLKGLLTLHLENIPEYFKNSLENIKKFNSVCDEEKILNSEGCIYFARSNKNIDYLVIGVDNVEQLKQNIENFDKGYDVDYIYRKIISNVKKEDRGIVIPSLWGNP